MTELSSQPGAALHELVDEMGLFFKNLGMPRAAGQLIGYLMACDPPEQSAGEISEAIGISAASVSSNVRLLTHFGAIELTSRRGDRKTFYRLRGDVWVEMMRQEFTAFESLAATGRRIKSSGGLVRHDGIDEMVDFAEFWVQEVPAMTARWQQTRSNRQES